MRKSFFKKALSLVCAAALLLGCAGGLATPASAAGATLGYWPSPLEIPNEYYYENQTLQPYGSCFQIDELKNWSPDNDPDARYNRGSIPLTERWMGPNVSPLTSRDAKVMPLAMANARASQAPSQGGDGASTYAFNNWQYVDTFNFWGGSSGEGPIAIPSPELIDAAHRNGVPVTGTIFLPWGDGTYGNQFVREMVEKDADGHFIAADKLVEIAQYYGFDGYIFNAESGTGVAGFKEFLAYLQTIKPDNFTITWYNGSGSLSTGSIQSWMQDGDTPITDGWWLDMSGGGYVDGTIQAAQEMGVNPWNIYSTWEYWPMSGMSGTKGGNYQTRLNDEGILKCSLGILAPTCTLTQATDPDNFMNVQDQKMWVGPSYDPSSTDRPSSEFCGFASMVADRTPVIGTDFVTNFTAGNGYKFYEDGVVTGKENGWFNRSLNDVLPTWRWIIESEGQELNAKIDYDDAWYAGTSMKIYGSMDANKANHVKLYSSQLAITEDTRFSLTYKTAKAGVNVELGLCFGDSYDAENFKFYPVTTTANGEWNTATVDLSGDAGKTAIAISLRFNAPQGVTNYAVNVGRMAFTTNNTAPAATAKVTLDEAIYPTDKTMEARVYWEKAENAFMYRIHRVHADGTREFVGATPSDCFYLGSYEKEAGETACTFEITSYSENGVKGGTKTFTIAWPKEVENGFVPVFDEGPNLALGQPAVSSVSCVADGPVHQINDGTVLNGSKWCSTSYQGYAVIDLGENKNIQRWVVYHANCPGAGESPDMNTVAFDFQYAADDGAALLTGNDYASRSHVAGLTWSVADYVTNNKQDITDRNLNAPITARYIKLNVTDSDNSAWSAIRIYEFEVYENPAIDNTPSPYERNVTVVNNAGATDTVVIDNVPMPYSSGSYPDGVLSEDTGKVRLFTDLTSTEPIAVVKATQPSASYEQRGVGIATFENLDLKAEGGRIFYDVLNGSGPEVTNSRRASVYYAPETGTAIKTPDSVTLERTTHGQQLRKQYATLTATGLEDGVTMKIYETSDAKTPVLHSMPAEDGVIRLSRVPLSKDGGTIYYVLRQEGRPDSARIAVEYGDPMQLAADTTGLALLVEKCEKIRQEDCTSATWTVFAEKLAAAKALLGERAVPTAAEAEAARLALNTAYADLRLKGNSQRLGELAAQFETDYPSNHYTASSFAAFKTALDNAKAAVAANDSSDEEYEQLRIKLEDGVRGLVEQTTTPVVTSIEITPTNGSVAKGGTLQFSAVVKGTGDVDQTVKWSVGGFNSYDTKISDTGLLTVARDESVKVLTVEACTPDYSVHAEVTVNVIDGDPVDPDPQPGELDEETNVALNATVIAYNGSNLGGTSGPEKLFDGKITDPDLDKWCVDGQNMWVAFDIGEARDFGKAALYHAEAAGEGPSGKINTSDYQLYVLDTTKISVEDLLAKTDSERNTLLADNSYWIEAASVTGNTSEITIDDLDVKDARIFKFNVSKTDTTGWASCVRIYELELYAYAKVSAEPELLSQNATILGVGNTTGTVTSEQVQSAFDGDYGTKWCSEKTPNWVAFDIGAAATATRIKVTHAGGATTPEDERFNTNDFDFEVLNPEKYTDEAFLALSESEKTAVMGDDANWVVLKDYKANELNVTDDELTTEISSRIYRLKVTDGDDNWWGGPDTVRIFEIELFGIKGSVQPPVENVTVTVAPKELTVDSNPGQKGQFTAVVEGTTNVEVEWTITGNTSDGTMIGNGQLFFGKDETAKTMTVTATSVADPTKSDSATVYVVDPTRTITVSADVVNGTITPSATEATRGTVITLTVEPAEGYRLKEGTLKCNGVLIEDLTFVMPDEDVVITAEFESIESELVAAARAAQKAAEEAQKAAEEAAKAAEQAKKDAETAASSAAADKSAADEAAKKAAEAQKLAEEAREAAKAAQKAAEDAAKAAEASNLAAAEKAAEAATKAADAATKANEAAASAATAAEAMQKAQAAQTAAEEAAKKAAEAQKKAEEAQKKAEEVAAAAAGDKEAADKARAEAEAARDAAKAAENAAKQSQEAAKLAREAAEQSNKEAAASAALAAEYAKQVTETYQEIVKIKLEMVEMLAEAQKNAAKAEEAKKAAEAAALASRKYAALLELAQYSKNTGKLNAHQQKAFDAALAAGKAAIDKAEDIKAVEKALADAKEAMKNAEKACPAASYTDVDLDAWYHESVDFMLASGYMKGVGNDKFDVDGNLTRAQLVTILYRIAGAPEIKDAKNPFTDVKAGEWYTDAIIWAAENGIVKGTSETTFDPDGKITREQIATILYRYAKAEAVKEDKLSTFPDAEKISDYAKDAMNWAVAEGLINGSDGKLLPQDFATRAQISAILMRYCEAADK